MNDVLDALRAGNPVLVATDTVYGVAAMPGTEGISRIFELKQRPASQTLPWLVGQASALDSLASHVPGYARVLADMFWPGALTLVVDASDAACELGDVAEDGTVALRMPDEPRLLELIESLGAPLACTSANVHGCPAASCVEELDERFANLPLLDGAGVCESGAIASTIVDCTREVPSILRDGAIPSSVVLDVALFGATLSE